MNVLTYPRYIATAKERTDNLTTTMNSQPEFSTKPVERMAEKPQDAFLKEMMQKGEYLTVFLINGVKLKGMLAGYDEHCIILSREESIQLVYKHAISTMMLFVERI